MSEAATKQEGEVVFTAGRHRPVPKQQDASRPGSKQIHFETDWNEKWKGDPRREDDDDM
jgi:hypothetical protein